MPIFPPQFYSPAYKRQKDSNAQPERYATTATEYRTHHLLHNQIDYNTYQDTRSDNLQPAYITFYKVNLMIQVCNVVSCELAQCHVVFRQLY